MMTFEGEETFSQRPDELWAALHDTGLLARTVPGCRSMILTGSNEYTIALSLGIAAVRGDYEGKVKVFDVKRPTHYMVKGEGSGAPGFVKMTVNCHLEPQAAGTLLKWHCDATVGGMIASIGGKALAGVAKFMSKQFFAAFKSGMAGAYPVDKTEGTGSTRPAQVGLARGALTASPSWFARFWNLVWLRFSRP